MLSSPRGRAWVVLALAIALHVADEALTGFLSVYNPTVLELQRRLGWWPMPVFTFEGWLSGLVIAVLLLLALTPFAARNSGWWRKAAYVLAVLMIANAAGHTLGTIFGRTFAEVQFSRPMPGFYSSPLLLAASVYLMVQLRKPAGIRVIT
ncbi:MAG: hypothetical protein HY820_39650 [Acidobacteria bacterium]|nr:hypothetical protein [Acidobacteriota bacterium]